MLLQQRHHLGHFPHLLADGHVHAEEVASLLIDDGVYGDDRLPDGPVADYQLSLASAYGNHAVDGLDAGLDRSVDPLPDGHVRGYDLHRAGPVGPDGPLPVDGPAQAVDDSAYERLADGDLDDLPRALDLASLFHGQRVPQDHRADAVLFQVERHSQDAPLELHELAGRNSGEPVDPGDAVTDLHDHADVNHGEVAAKPLDLALDYGRDILSSNCHHILRELSTLPAGRRILTMERVFKLALPALGASPRSWSWCCRPAAGLRRGPSARRRSLGPPGRRPAPACQRPPPASP